MKTFHTRIYLHNISAIDFVGPDTTVVGTLGSREAVLRPAQGMAISVQQGILLLHPKPRFLLLGFLHHLPAQLAVVGPRGSLVVLVGLAHHHDVLSTSDGIRVDLAGVEVSVGVTALRLVGGAPVIVPDGKVGHRFWGLVQGLSLGPQPLPGTIHPDIESLNSDKTLSVELSSLESIISHLPRWFSSKYLLRAEPGILLSEICLDWTTVRHELRDNWKISNHDVTISISTFRNCKILLFGRRSEAWS